MQRATYMYLAAATATLIVLLTVISGGGLPRSTRTLLDAENREYPTDVSRCDTQRKTLLQRLEANPDLFDQLADDWKRRADAADAKLNEAKPKLAQAVSYAEKDDAEQRVEIERLLQDVRQARVFAVTELGEMVAAADKLVYLRDNLPGIVGEARENAAKIEAVPLAELEARVATAATDWPNKKSDLTSRLAGVKELQAGAKADLARVEAEQEKTVSEIQWSDLSHACDDLEDMLPRLNAARDNLAGLIDQLYISWDDILADMDIREGSDVKFAHLMRRVRVRVGAEGEEGTTLPAVERWVDVSKQDYERHKKHLGMTLASKPAGLYDSEVNSGNAQPAGLSYIADPREGSNRYGRWENRNGSSFWVFYGQYRFMESLFWGPSWRPIGASSWNDYDSYRRRGQTYYGRSSSGGDRYGSSGTATKSKFASSKYVKSGGFKSSQYVKSGGSYRGSRYATKSSRSSSFGSSSRSSGGK